MGTGETLDKREHGRKTELTRQRIFFLIELDSWENPTALEI